MALKPIILSATMLFLAACQSSPSFKLHHIDEEADLVKTWSKALVALPQKSDLLPLDQVNWAAQKKAPLMIYLHGCTGLGEGDRAMMREVAQLGMVVIAPNSMARDYRPLQCNPDDQSGGYHYFVYALREAELAFAIYQAEQMPWLKRDQMALMGGSEGAVTAALYRGAEFKVRILLQWTCHGAPYIQGLAAGPKERVLALVNYNDPWYQQQRADKQGISQAGHCGDFDRFSHVSSQVLPYEGHDLLQDAFAKEQIKTFLEDTLLRP